MENKGLKTVETRKDELRFTTGILKEMQGKFLAERLLRSWKEDFLDEHTGEVVSIERSEIIMDRGLLLDGDNLAVINFHMEAGDIKEVTVSNQRRRAFVYETNHLSPWFASIQIDKKKKKFILYASSLEMVLEIVKDYAELNFVQPFYFTNAKEFDSCILLKDTLKKYQVDKTLDLDNFKVAEDEDESTAGKFYQIDVTVKNEQVTYPQAFVIETADVDKAMLVIRDFINKRIAASDNKNEKVEIKLEGAKVIPCDIVIEKEFSMAYLNDYPDAKETTAEMIHKEAAKLIETMNENSAKFISSEQAEEIQESAGRNLAEAANKGLFDTENVKVTASMDKFQIGPDKPEAANSSELAAQDMKHGSIQNAPVLPETKKKGHHGVRANGSKY